MMNPTFSALIVDQRIRNRVIECLEWITTARAQGNDCDLNELVNCWDDWVPDAQIDSAFPQPPYTMREVACLKRVQDVMARFCKATPPQILYAKQEMLRPEWLELEHAAEMALQEMNLRGKLSEEGKLL